MTPLGSSRNTGERLEEVIMSVNFISKHRFTWEGYNSSSTPTNLKVETTVLVYLDVSAVVFDVVYLTGLTNAADPSNRNGTLSSFPSFYVEDNVVHKKGWMTWSGNSKSCTQPLRLWFSGYW